MAKKRLIDEGSLWIMVAAPSVWAAHFLLSYWIAAVWCAKLGGPLETVRFWVLVLGAGALAIIALLAWYAAWRYQGRLVIHEDLTKDSEAGRERFLGHATLLLCSLSAVAVVFDMLPALVFERCF